MQKEEALFHEELHTALELARKYATENRNAEYGPSHLLKAILHRDLSLLKELESMKKDVFFIEEWAEVRIDDELKAGRPTQPEPNGDIDKVINEADEIRDILGRSEVDLYCVMVALATPGVGFTYDQMKSFPVVREELLTEVDHNTTLEATEEKATNSKSIKYLFKYCKDKLVQVRKRPKKIVAREKEIKEIVEIICRFVNPNVLLQGYPGVGKTALIEGFVNLVANKQVPDKLIKTKIYELDLGTLIAGASYKGEIEDRLKKILQELKTYPQAILIIDGIHVLLDKNSDNAGISSILKSELSGQEGLTLIVTTTIDEYTKKIEKDESLSGMFEVIKVEEPDEKQAFRIIKSALTSYLVHHEIKVTDDSIEESIRLSKRYLKEKSLPESALNLLDRTMSVIKTAGISFLKEKEVLQKRLESIKQKESYTSNKSLEYKWFYEDLKRKSQYLLSQEKELSEDIEKLSEEELYNYLNQILEKLSEASLAKKEHIEPIDLAAVVAQKTGIPLGKLHSEEKDRLQNMEEILKKRVVGQNYAIQVITEAVLESRSGLSKAGQPMGSFFFLGPTGTGKTELAKSLADFLFQDENAIIRFDMSEFKEEHSAALLYGAPPGYVGYEEGGLLVNKIRQKPYSIVLFDEIEKAHSSVFDVFLQIMDEGKLHDRLGKEGDFSNALILFTSNIGAQFIVNSVNEGKGLPPSNQLMEIMTNNFRPEFLGRLTEIIPFSPITKENALGIFKIHLKKELLDLVQSLNINLEISDEAQSYLVDNGFNATYGARPLKGIIRSELRRPMAKKIISGEIKEGDQVEVYLENKQLNWKIK
ncbi:ATP-dependent Clp protease ATP-binding subunit [Apibacter muscae]|uniref:ATP-dependent Clp protease ATP-binding subunit n=1 Tax=Apibacter muscae TaxID=2509004 RepID=A0A563DD75_9FLAO|nr:ATP-dependent Clp protease ATP-binding subunit [Apibacter muscae]TWP27734.1 ATP-dependent Clp protease ATP-binding subunit [Apibacter muscae]TWP29554.1 ATP-dependent Clp protease ATP-binding subunit [Apibacter muscae]